MLHMSKQSLLQMVNWNFPWDLDIIAIRHLTTKTRFLQGRFYVCWNALEFELDKDQYAVEFAITFHFVLLWLSYDVDGFSQASCSLTKVECRDGIWISNNRFMPTYKRIRHDTHRGSYRYFVGHRHSPSFPS